MRIISGELKGRRIEAPSSVRPTGERVRGALFSILGGHVAGTFVDLYAGSGSVGLEARSRGARVVLVERDEASLEALAANLAAAGDPEGVAVVPADVLKFLKAPALARRPPLPAWATREAAVVFADPPYDYPLRDKLLRALEASPIVGADTVLVVEHGRQGLGDVPEGLTLERTERYGETALSFLRKVTATR